MFLPSTKRTHKLKGNISAHKRDTIDWQCAGTVDGELKGQAREANGERPLSPLVVLSSSPIIVPLIFAGGVLFLDYKQTQAIIIIQSGL